MPASADSVPVEVLRRALDDADISQRELAHRMGWYRTVPDTDKIRRALGLTQSGGGRPKQKVVSYGRALQLIEAMGLEPVDYGL